MVPVIVLMDEPAQGSYVVRGQSEAGVTEEVEHLNTEFRLRGLHEVKVKGLGDGGMPGLKCAVEKRDTRQGEQIGRGKKYQP